MSTDTPPRLYVATNDNERRIAREVRAQLEKEKGHNFSLSDVYRTALIELAKHYDIETTPQR